MLLQDQKINSFFIYLSIAILLIPAASVGPAQEQEQEPAMGQLKIEGSHIESLVLRSKVDWHTESFQQPFETRRLPVGEYRLQNIRLKGDYSCGTRENITVSIVKDKSAIFKVGAPLKHTIEVKRQGRALVLTYKLLGMAGEDYSAPTTDNQPGLSIMKGDEEIASGKFEYG